MITFFFIPSISYINRDNLDSLYYQQRLHHIFPYFAAFKGDTKLIKYLILDFFFINGFYFNISQDWMQVVGFLLEIIK